MKGTYYVYRIFNEYDDTLYIGKGSGDRLQQQIKRFGFFGHKLKWFEDEQACLKEEIRLIAKLNPPFNKTKGGEAGGRPKTEIDVYRELCRLIRLAVREPDLHNGLMVIVLKWVERLGYRNCVEEFKKRNVFWEIKYVS